MRLSIVVTTRNDDHGGTLTRRTNIFIHTLAELARRHDLDAELIIVEWNPPPGRRPLAQELTWPATLDPLQVRIVTVPPEYHHRLHHSDVLPLYQMIAKNVGIRRARGRWVLATNPDLIYSDGMVDALSHRRLYRNRYYRTNRVDLDCTATPFASVDRVLEFCASNRGEEHGPPRRGPHTIACGDFTLLARERWHELRGYPEYQLWSPHIDSLFLFMCEAAGLQETILPHPIYHPLHSESWASPDCPTDRPMLPLRTVLAKREEMLDLGQPLIDNLADWGLGGEDLPEQIIKPIARPAVAGGTSDGLTIFAVPRAFTGEHRARQDNAIQSWLHLDPRPEVLLLGDDPGVAEAAARHGVRHVPLLATNEHGTPYLDDAFAVAQREAAHDCLCYVNADIIMPGTLPAALDKVRSEFPTFLLTGARCDLDLDEPLDFAGDWAGRLAALVQDTGHLYLLSGMDWWAFRRGLYGSVPSLLVGRTAWDNWLLADALGRGIPTVDASRYVLAIHQGASQRLDPGHHERIHNHRTYQAAGLPHHGELPETEWLLDGAGALHPRTPEWGRPVLQRQERFIGTAPAIVAGIAQQHPLVEEILAQVRRRVGHCKVEVWYEQAAVLYHLARQYNHHGAQFLEIGTAWGYSAAVLAVAASLAHLTTLEPDPGRHRLARRNLESYGNATVVKRESTDFRQDYPGPPLDLIFIDGNQKRIAEDLQWWNWLKFGGLLLVHDYTPAHAPARPCGRVYEALHRFADVRGRPPDVLQQDEREVGMAGWYRRDGEPDWEGRW